MGARSVENAREAVLAVAKDLSAKGLVEGTAGHARKRRSGS